MISTPAPSALTTTAMDSIDQFSVPVWSARETKSEKIKASVWAQTDHLSCTVKHPLGNPRSAIARPGDERQPVLPVGGIQKHPMLIGERYLPA